MTAQEVFDTVWTAMTVQRVPAFNSDKGMCMYRYEGLKCAVGCLMTDEEAADMGYEGISASNVPPRLYEHLYLLQKLQKAHDDTAIVSHRSSWLDSFRESARIIAQNFNLSVPE